MISRIILRWFLMAIGAIALLVAGHVAKWPYGVVPLLYFSIGMLIVSYDIE